MFGARFDFGELDVVLDRLEGPVRESLARRMGVEGGVLIRDEAKARATFDPYWQPKHPGLLASSMYLARNEQLSNEYEFVYSVSWNRTKAPHAHLVEVGHCMPYRVHRNRITGKFRTDKTDPLPGQGKWVPAYPFLRPAWDARKHDAVVAMMTRGKQELPILLRGDGHDV
jgi:hypothetical protein